ncbi:unnamed protein product, partial [Didymodactylos carnosus]
ISKYSLITWKLVECWTRNQFLLKKEDEYIRCIRANENGAIIGMTVREKNWTWKINLYDLNMKLVRQGLQIGDGDVLYSNCLLTPTSCSEVPNGIWLFINSDSGQSWLIDEYGRIRQNEAIKNVRNACFLQNYLVLKSKEPSKLGIYQLS